MSATISIKQHPFWMMVEVLNNRPDVIDSSEASIPAFKTEKSFIAFGQKRLELAFSLFVAMAGDPFTAEFDRYELACLERFVSETPFGLIVGTSAMQARKTLTSFPAFAKSLWLPGVVQAVIHWMNSCGFREDDNWKTTLANLWKGDGTPLDELLFKMCLDSAPDSAAFARELSLMIRRRDDAEKKKIGRNKNQKKNRFKDEIRRRWIVDALWCRSTHGILLNLDPKGKHLATDLDLIIADVSRLSLSASRCPSNELAIKKQEAEFVHLFDS
jgi:hypothetical protein